MLQEYPTEIEADLRREYGVDIGDWYRGEVSSRDTLVKIWHLSDTSQFKLAQDWPLEVQFLARLINEVAAMRADLYGLIGKQVFTFKPLLSPSAKQAQAAKTAQIRAAHDEVMAQLRGRKD